MSVLIQGIDIPEVFCGADIVLYEGINGSAVPRKYKISADRVAQVPPHGDLIERDALEQDAQKRLLECEKYDNQFQKPYEVMRAIALAPTVIPAEPKEKT